MNEHLYPDNIKSPDLRGSTVQVEVLGTASQYHENYASVWSSFYLTDKGYASYFDTFAKGQYTFGVNGTTSLYHRTGKLDWYLFYGPSGDKIMNEYYSIIGKPKYVPIWACGTIIWRDQNNGGSKEILEDISKMTDLKIPLTGWFVDRPYSDGAHEWSKMDFNSKFSDPGKWISEINNKYGLQFMTWVGPMTFTDKDFPGLLPNYKGYIDLTNPAALKEFERRMKKNQYAFNVRGHKMDRADEQFPEAAKWYDNTPDSQHRNKYIYLYAKTINKFLTDSFGKDEFNFARAAYNRCQQYLSAVWGGDSRSTWDGLAGSIANAVRTGYMGFPVWGSDVGGYLGGRISADLYSRWLEFGSWSGMFEVKIDHSGGKGEDRPPWKYGKELQDVFREACEQRMKMLPYVYSAANTSYKNGVLMKPISYVYPDDKKTYNIWNEYMFGNAFLVAPIYDSTFSRKVYLPEGKWYDFNNTGMSYSGGISVNVNAPLGVIPVFVKANSIYVTGEIYRGNSKICRGKPSGDITVHVFPGENGKSYQYDYVDYYDNNKEKRIEVSNNHDNIEVNSDPLNSAGKIIIKINKKPEAVELNGGIADYNWNGKEATIELPLKKKIENKILIRK